MKQVELHLIPTPGAKPEFLATVESVTDTTSAALSKLPAKIVLEGYTRDAWAWKPHPQWTAVEVRSVDGRNKLPGFLDYLKGRQKSAYGRFSPTAVFCVSYIQPTSKTSTTAALQCRFTMNVSSIPQCPFAVPSKTGATQRPPPTATNTATNTTAAKSTTTATKSGRPGILGNLLKGQQRTNQHLENTVTTKKSSSSTASSSSLGKNGANDIDDMAIPFKTAQTILAEFRQSVEQQLLDFDISGDTVWKIKLSLAQITAGLQDDDDDGKARITMDVLKFIVYEQAEEVNEEWVAAREPSEFMDEVIIAVYKEGCAPAEVLEDMNKADVPDEVRGQQRAIQEARRKEMAQKEAKLHQERMSQAIRAEEEEEFSALNVNKRDRRTIEEIQRESIQPKRRKGM